MTGRDGIRLGDHWADGTRTLHGIHVHGFPNLFLVQHSQDAYLLSTIPHNPSEPARAVTAVVRHLPEGGHREVEATGEAVGSCLDLLTSGAGRRGRAADCTPGYYNSEGRDPGPGRLAVGHPDGPSVFFALLERWHTSGSFDGLEFC
ncbi:hypothetical protein [Streptomyces sp. NBC_01497]|uniref:hypothetical protein n=1 Tax=Streptomyces sp. NBC_01497 TaxID=2903885 RepID=UPI002E2F9F31|nr:hypothetical protein [Streptomyces sp. NBC_01497]